MKSWTSAKRFSILAVFLCAAVCLTGFFLAMNVLSSGATASSRDTYSSVSSEVSGKPASELSAPSSAIESEPVGAPAAEQKRELVLVNNEHEIPSWYTAQLISVSGVQVDSEAAAAFAEMRTQASADGITLWISSAYRSRELQSRLFQEEVETFSKTSATYSEAEALAEQSVARPGFSEHETGLALDLNGVKEDFDQTAEYRWLSRHAQDFGFVLRYPKDKQKITGIKFEPWHFRYVSTEAAKAMKSAGMCLEEYVEEQNTASLH